MKYDFNAPVDRTTDNSVKHHNLIKEFGTEDVLPFWIADMDLKVPQPIIDALHKRVDIGVFGYTKKTPAYDEAIVHWQKKKNNWEITTDCVSFCYGVVQALAYCIDQFSKPKDGILIFTPGYVNFFKVIEGLDREVWTSSLVEKDCYFTIDFEDFEEKLKQKPAMVIMCNPHNPVGRSWTKDELTRVGELCFQYDVMLISDEIHSDLTLWGNQHIPMASINQEFGEKIITCTSITKTFNLAGIQAATVIFPNAKMTEEYDAFWAKYHVNQNNAFNETVVTTAYTQGEEWLEQVLTHIEGNITYVVEYIREKIPQIKVGIPEATYLLWLDCRALGMNMEELSQFMISKAKLGLNKGSDYGKDGEGYMRFNVACPRPMLEEAMKRLENAVNSL